MISECDAMVSVRGLTLNIGNKDVLSDVSFEIRKGDFCSVIGPNGAGKSTLLKCLDRLLDGWRGEITICGSNVRNISRKKLSRLVGYVPQLRDMPPEYSVEEFLAMSRFAAGESNDDKELYERSLEKVGLGGFQKRGLQTLSGGECQKVFIAAGLVQETPVLLLDEPAAFLDPRYQSEVSHLLIELNEREGVTIICVSHDLNAALRQSSRILALKQGRLAFDRTPEEVMADHLLNGLFDTSFTVLRHPADGRTAVFPL